MGHRPRRLLVHAHRMATTLIWRFAIRFQFPGLADIHEVIPAFVLSFAAYLIISRLTQDHQPSPAHLQNLFRS